ncbi:hypothetical protein POM88_051793 [Heracleum sosnowskyi]|uniref:Uncharacterized protein n=1 Tax=Heracleum sosnowskyi TaxID=360622 RepID=A0AAD8H063_9APIA|nr:hypothetical protein POM88_051793 [Heracleum sosnowskyi]
MDPVFLSDHLKKVSAHDILHSSIAVFAGVSSPISSFFPLLPPFLLHVTILNHQVYDELVSSVSLEDLEIILKDYVRKGGFNKFVEPWDAYKIKRVVSIEKETLPASDMSLEDARNWVINLFEQMKVEHKDKKRHTVYLSSKFIDDIDLLAMAEIRANGQPILTGGPKIVTRISFLVKYSDATNQTAFLSYVDDLFDEFLTRS